MQIHPPPNHQLTEGKQMADKDNTLTQEYVKHILHYDPETGDFIRLKRTGRTTHTGDILGCISKGASGKRYTVFMVKNILYGAHRLAFFYMEGRWPNNEIDHIDGNGLNNKWNNLREVTHQENMRNTKLSSTNTSGHIGVYWSKALNKWRSQIMINDKCMYLGIFIEIKDAIKARKEAEAKYGFHPNHGSVRTL